jgi:hypothetical protein
MKNPLEMDREFAKVVFFLGFENNFQFIFYFSLIINGLCVVFMLI